MSAQINITPEIGTFVPAEHVQEHKAPKAQPTGKALDQLKAVLKKIDAELDDSARSRVGRWVRNHMLVLYGGVNSTWGMYNSQAGQWDTLDDDDYGRLYNVNLLLQAYVTLKATLERSRVKLKFQPAAAKTDDIHIKMAADVGQRKIDHDLATEIDAEFYSREFSYMLLCGTYARYRGFDKSQGPMEQAATLEDNQVAQPGSYFCTDPSCGAGGATTALNGENCPKCGGDVVQTPGNILQSTAHTGYNDVRAGGTCTYSVNPFELGMPNEATGPDKSPFLRWEQRTRPEYIAYKYGIDPKLLKGGELLSPALIALLVIQNYGQNIRTTDQNFGVFRRYWLEPFMYSEIELQEETQLAGGVTLPAGKLTKYAPDGLYIAKMGDVFLDIQPGCASDCWSGGQYHHRPNSPYGLGIDDGADIQEWESEALSIKIEHAQRDSVGMTFFKGILGIDQSKMVGGANIKVNAPDPEIDLDKSIKQINPNPQSNALDATIQIGRDSMIAVMGSYGVLSGASENAPETATGISLLQEKAVGIQGPFLARWAASWCVWGVQGLRASQKYQSVEQLKPFTDRNNTESAKWFKQSNLTYDFTLTAEEDSWIPRTRLDNIANFERMVTLLTALLPLAKNPDQLPDVGRIFSHYAALLNAPNDIDATQRDEQLARAIIDKVEAGCAAYEAKAQMTQRPITPDQYPEMLQRLQTMPSIQALPQIGSQQVFITAVQDELKELLDNDDPADEPSELVIQALMALVDIGKKAMLAQAQEQGQMAAAANPQPQPPDPMQIEGLKQQGEAATQQAETERQQSQQQHERQSQLLQVVNDQATREQDTEDLHTELAHDRAESAQERESDGEKATEDRKHQIALLKAKSKPSPGKK